MDTDGLRGLFQSSAAPGRRTRHQRAACGRTRSAPERLGTQPGTPHGAARRGRRSLQVCRGGRRRLAAESLQVGIPIEGQRGQPALCRVPARGGFCWSDRAISRRSGSSISTGSWPRSAPRAGQAGAGAVDAGSVFGRRAEAVVAQAMDQGRVVSEASLSLLSPAERGIWVAAPIIDDGGISRGGLALAVSLDDIASTVQAEARNTSLIAFVLLGFTAAAALWGTRWLTHPIEVIASAARQVEAGKQPDEGPMEDVIKRHRRAGQPGARVRGHDGAGLQPRRAARDDGLGTDRRASAEQPQPARRPTGAGAGPRDGQGGPGRPGSRRQREPRQVRGPTRG